MDQSAPRSLRHEYDLFIENEIEAYKDSITRTALLSIGDEAVASLQSATQFSMNELLLVNEVDKIIRKRQALPTYQTWRKRELKRRKEREEFLRPEHWGLRPDGPLAREIHPSSEARVLVAGAEVANAALYFAANGCEVTAINGGAPIEESALSSTDISSLSGRIDHHAECLNEWAPAAAQSLTAVVCTGAAFAGLSAKERARVFEVLQSVTEDGGVHLVETIVASQAGLSVSELRKRYKGWEVSVVEDGAAGKSFVARKAVA